MPPEDFDPPNDEEKRESDSDDTAKSTDKSDDHGDSENKNGEQSDRENEVSEQELSDDNNNNDEDENEEEPSFEKELFDTNFTLYCAFVELIGTKEEDRQQIIDDMEHLDDNLKDVLKRCSDIVDSDVIKDMTCTDDVDIQENYFVIMREIYNSEIGLIMNDNIIRHLWEKHKESMVSFTKDKWDKEEVDENKYREAKKENMKMRKSIDKLIKSSDPNMLQKLQECGLITKHDIKGKGKKQSNVNTPANSPKEKKTSKKRKREDDDDTKHLPVTSNVQNMLKNFKHVEIVKKKLDLGKAGAPSSFLKFTLSDDSKVMFKKKELEAQKWYNSMKTKIEWKMK